MKQLICAAAIVFIGLYAHSQATEPDPPYLRFPTVPPVKLLMVDSATYFSKEKLKKNQPVLYIVFNPQCEHCQHETKEITANIDKFKKIQIIMATPETYDKMKAFYEEYKLKNYPNITMGRDEHFTLPSFFSIRNLPYLAFYDKNQKLISVHEGTYGVPKILEEFNKK
jgi:thiol-disulfide isomerase/thioredoxin